MGCPGLVLHQLFLPTSSHWLTTVGRVQALPLLWESWPIGAFPFCYVWRLTVSVGKSAVLTCFTAFLADLRCACGFMMVILIIWQTIAFCDPSACSALLDYTWTSATTLSTERGKYFDVGCFGFGGLLRVWWLCLWWFWCVFALVLHLLCFTSS